MFASVCLRVCLCVCVCVYVRASVCLLVCLCAYACVPKYVCVFVGCFCCPPTICPAQPPSAPHPHPHLRRYEQYTSLSGQQGSGSSPLPASAIRSALRYAQQHNAWALLTGAQVAAVQAWAQLVEVAFTRQYEALAAILPGGGGGGGPALVLHEVLVACLEVRRGGGCCYRQ